MVGYAQAERVHFFQDMRSDSELGTSDRPLKHSIYTTLENDSALRRRSTIQ